MSETKRVIRIDRTKITDRETCQEYMKELFELPEYFGGNLDALADCLSEISDETSVVMSSADLKRAAKSDYAWKTVRVLILAALMNPKLNFTIE